MKLVTPLDEHNWQPATLRERGVAVSFTSPMLAGARIRLSERRSDLLVPHPGGARGVYIFALASLAEFCVPTLHDLRLAERLATLRPPTPASVRLAARAVAAEGTAGRAAAAAAAAAAAHDRQARAHFESTLLNALPHQVGPRGNVVSDKRGAQAVLKLANRTGRDAEAVRADIGLLSDALAAAGLDACVGGGGLPTPGDAQAGRCRALLGSIQSMCHALLAWAAARGPDDACDQVAAVAAATWGAGRLLLAASQKLLEDPVALLDAWAASPDNVTARLCRPDWLLDGWEHLCLLWLVAETDAERAEAVAEIRALLPPIPAEAEAWLGQVPDLLAPLRGRRAASAGSTSRSPSQLVALVARNERIRALAA